MAPTWAVPGLFLQSGVHFIYHSMVLFVCLFTGDVNKSLFYCNLHKSIKTQTLNLQPTSAALQDIFASDQTMTSLEHECLDGLNKCLDEESCCFLCFHCDDTVFHAWLFNKHILLTHSESLADLRRDYGIESAQTVADFFGFLSRRLLETIDDEDSGEHIYRSLFLVDAFSFKRKKVRLLQ